MSTAKQKAAAGKTFTVSLPQIAFVAATRGLGGAGAALLLGPHLQPRTRTRLGWMLLGIGVLTTIPIAARVIALRNRAGETLH
jgi:hypothetical protein